MLPGLFGALSRNLKRISMATVENKKDDIVTIEVDGRSVEARKGEMIIQATDRAGMEIPRFCYHHKLSIAANCRMCLVDVEKAPKPMPACATPVADRSEERRVGREC